jgi:hypothetical protein
MMLDEESLRRPDFLPGIPVRMADGQIWSLPKTPDRYPWMADGGAPGRIDAASGVGSLDAEDEAEEGGGLGQVYTATVAAVLDAEDETERLRAELALAIALLARNYDLGPADYQELLDSESGSPVTVAMQRAFHTVALEHARSLSPHAGAEPACRPRGRILSYFGHFLVWGHRPADPASGLPEVCGVRWDGPGR